MQSLINFLLTERKSVPVQSSHRSSDTETQWLPSQILTKDITDLIEELQRADTIVFKILSQNISLQNAREKLEIYLNSKESDCFNPDSSFSTAKFNATEYSNAKECIRVFKNIIRVENENRTGFSALQLLRNAVQNRNQNLISPSFLSEIISLLHGINGNGLSFLVNENQQDPFSGQESFLNSQAQLMNEKFSFFTKGTDSAMTSRQKMVKKRILKYYNAHESDWGDYHWHLSHIFRSKNAISSIIHLEMDEITGLQCAEKENIPVQITPYYLSLFNPDGRDKTDRALRAQVIPSAGYSKTVATNRAIGKNMDYMGESLTSPTPGITRRYPSIVILKVFDSCPQICVYCQRNWEIKNLEQAFSAQSRIDSAISWIKAHDEITEVLVTGGDPLTLDNKSLHNIIGRIAAIEHVERIRIGTRTPVTLPYRIDEGFLELLKSYHKPGYREIAVMTHVENPAELTPDALDAITKIRQCGIAVYNQQVFTYYNSKKFETAYLRKCLKISGIDPYYTFNTKGKEETSDFRVPIARLLQERKEEARLLPGVIRSDEPVFNVPRIGKSHLRAWQDHEPIMILADGRRVYRFIPWESRLTTSIDYLYTDVSIYDYLKRLYQEGEDVDQYRTVWYYF